MFSISSMNTVMEMVERIKSLNEEIHNYTWKPFTDTSEEFEDLLSRRNVQESNLRNIYGLILIDDELQNLV
jgi:hypothetical protein